MHRFFMITALVVSLGTLATGKTSTPWLPATFAGPAWTGGVVPYRFDGAVTPAQQLAILDAMAEIEGVSGVNFVPRTNQVNFITIRPNPSPNCNTTCSRADRGMMGGEQFVDIGSSHWNLRFIVVHEFLHTLGFRHEHQRPDRGMFVQILLQNVSQTACSGSGSCNGNFTLDPAAITFGSYDFASVMHYSSTGFSANGQPTIVPQPAYVASGSLMGNRDNLSPSDVVGLQAIYGQPSAPIITSITPTFVVNGVTPPVVTINGTRFYEGSNNASGAQGTEVRWNGQTFPVTYVSPTQVQFPLTPALVAAAGIGCATLQINNPSPGGGTSNVATFNIISLAPTAGVFRGTWEGERLGQAVAGLRDLDGDGQDDVVVGIPGALGGSGRVICYSGATGQTLWLVNGAVDSDLGTSVARGGDINGDGVDDVLAGAPGESSGAGRLHILSGVDGSLIRVRTGTAGSAQGYSVANAGDVNGDGVPDQIVGAPLAGGLTGQARVYSGATGGILFSLAGSAAGDQFGSAVGGGYDVSGNGGPDVVVGAPFADPNGSNSGMIRVFSGQTGGVLVSRNGDGANDQFGFSVAIVPPLNGGSLGNIVVGANEPGSLVGAGTGAGYVRIFGPTQSGAVTLATLVGDAVGDRFGACVRFAGDLDQDGRAELVVGATQNGTPSGATGPGYIRVFNSDLSIRATYNGQATGDRFGTSVDAAGDTDGDGRADIIAGAPLNDATCVGAGEARVFFPRVPPAFQRLLLTEVTWGNPDGVELTNFSSATLNLANYRLVWDDGLAGGAKVAVLSGSLPPGGVMVVSETFASGFSEIPTGTPVQMAFPNLATIGQDITVTLEDPSGTVLDGVRISDTAGNHVLSGIGEMFRGLVVRTPSHVSAERIFGLDSNSGADWTAQTMTSMGLQNRSSGPRGTDPVPVAPVLITEVDVNPDYIEIRNTGGVVLNLRNWRFLAVSGNQGNPVVLSPWPGNTLISVFSRRVIGDGAAEPAELLFATGYTNLSSVGGGNIPFTGAEFALGLYDDYGRLVDLLRTESEDGPTVHHAPRLPGHWSAFTGSVPRTTVGDAGVGRIGDADDDTGANWRAVQTRSMGASNSNAGFIGPVGLGYRLDVRVSVTALGDVTTVFNADPAFAGHSYFFLMSAGHVQGSGPFYGLGMDALTNFQAFGLNPPFTGTLDSEGSARVELDASLPPGIAFDVIYFLVDPSTGSLSAHTAIVEFDS